MILTKRLIGLGLCVVVLSQASASSAQDTKTPLSDIFACSDIKANQERWDCYDKSIPILRAKEEKQEIIALDSQDVTAIERDAFGFSLPKLNVFKSSKKSNESNRKKAKSDKRQVFDVKSINRGRAGLYISMANGHVWQQVTGQAGYVPKGKLQATIKPAVAGSFLLSLQNEKGKTVRRGVRVKRVK